MPRPLIDSVRVCVASLPGQDELRQLVGASDDFLIDIRVAGHASLVKLRIHHVLAQVQEVRRHARTAHAALDPARRDPPQTHRRIDLYFCPCFCRVWNCSVTTLALRG